MTTCDKLRYFCDGPQGHFWTDSLDAARWIVEQIDFDDEWTITDTKEPGLDHV